MRGGGGRGVCPCKTLRQCHNEVQILTFLPPPPPSPICLTPSLSLCTTRRLCSQFRHSPRCPTPLLRQPSDPPPHPPCPPYPHPSSPPTHTPTPTPTPPPPPHPTGAQGVIGAFDRRLPGGGRPVRRGHPGWWQGSITPQCPSNCSPIAPPDCPPRHPLFVPPINPQLTNMKNVSKKSLSLVFVAICPSPCVPTHYVLAVSHFFVSCFLAIPQRGLRGARLRTALCVWHRRPLGARARVLLGEERKKLQICVETPPT